MDFSERENLKKLLVKAINPKQILILSQIENNRFENITSLLKIISTNHKIPLSTLKLNAKLLKELGLISYGSVRKMKISKLTKFGKNILDILKGN